MSFSIFTLWSFCQYSTDMTLRKIEGEGRRGEGSENKEKEPVKYDPEKTNKKLNIIK